jgi:hypothetical protein
MLGKYMDRMKGIRGDKMMLDMYMENMKDIKRDEIKGAASKFAKVMVDALRGPCPGSPGGVTFFEPQTGNGNKTASNRSDVPKSSEQVTGHVSENKNGMT